MRALRAGATPDEVFAATGIDPWFVDQLVLVSETADLVRDAPELTAEVLHTAKRHGLSDGQIAALRHLSEAVVRGVRLALGVRPVSTSATPSTPRATCSICSTMYGPAGHPIDVSVKRM